MLSDYHSVQSSRLCYQHSSGHLSNHRKGGRALPDVEHVRSRGNRGPPQCNSKKHPRVVAGCCWDAFNNQLPVQALHATVTLIHPPSYQAQHTLQRLTDVHRFVIKKRGDQCQKCQQYIATTAAPSDRPWAAAAKNWTTIGTSQPISHPPAEVVQQKLHRVVEGRAGLAGVAEGGRDMRIANHAFGTTLVKSGSMHSHTAISDKKAHLLPCQACSLACAARANSASLPLTSENNRSNVSLQLLHSSTWPP
jgi:hypothetical protein